MAQIIAEIKSCQINHITALGEIKPHMGKAVKQHVSPLFYKDKLKNP